jgi:hypothetical protein
LAGALIAEDTSTQARTFERLSLASSSRLLSASAG